MKVDKEWLKKYKEKIKIMCPESSLEKYFTDKEIAGYKLDKAYTQNSNESCALLEPEKMIKSIEDESHKLVAGMQLNYGFRINEVAKINLNEQLNNNILSV